MFTGLVEGRGTVASVSGLRLRLATPPALLDAAAVGDSVAVDGCCLTIVALGEEADGSAWWEADLSPETTSRTTLGALAVGQAVNLERPVRLADRLGGHLVQGHVDGIGEVLDPAPGLRVRLPEGIGRYVVARGSIAVDGVSLTVAGATADTFTAAVIPHTAGATTLGAKRRGDRVNLEVDVVAKYVERLLAGSGAPAGDER